MKRVLMCVVMLLWSIPTAMASDVTFGLMTNDRTDQLESRVGIELGDLWEVGGLLRWYIEQSDGTDWGVGAYAKMAVNPDASIPLAEWLPGLGSWLDLPESITAETYLIGKFVYNDFDEVGATSPDALTAELGAGAQVGVVCVELVYKWVEGGLSDMGNLDSGVELWFGGCINF